MRARSTRYASAKASAPCPKEPNPPTPSLRPQAPSSSAASSTTSATRASPGDSPSACATSACPSRLVIDAVDVLARLVHDLDPAATDALVRGIRIADWDAFEAEVSAGDLSRIGGVWPSLVFETFGCRLPDAVEAGLCDGRTRLWVNLDYLSAEEWVEGRTWSGACIRRCPSKSSGSSRASPTGRAAFSSRTGSTRPAGPSTQPPGAVRTVQGTGFARSSSSPTPSTRSTALPPASGPRTSPST